MLGARPLSDAVALIVPVASEPPLTGVPSADVVPYSNFGVVKVDPAVIVPLNVADVAPIAVGLLVLMAILPTDDDTFDDVQPPAGRTAASSLAAWSSRSAATCASVAPAAFMIS